MYILLWMMSFVASVVFVQAEHGKNESFSEEKYYTLSHQTPLNHLLFVSEQKSLPILFMFLADPWCPWSCTVKTELLESDFFCQRLKEVCLLVEVPLGSCSECSDVESLIRGYGITKSAAFVLVSPHQEMMLSESLEGLSQDSLVERLIRCCAYFEKYRLYLSERIPQYENEALKGLYLEAKELNMRSCMETIISHSSKNDLFFLIQKYDQMCKRHKHSHRDLKKLRETIKKLDPNNKKSSFFSMALCEFHALKESKYDKNEYKKVVAPLKEYVKSFGDKDRDNIWNVHALISEYYFSKGLYLKASKYAQKAQKLAPSERRKELETSIDYIKAHLAN